MKISASLLFVLMSVYFYLVSFQSSPSTALLKTTTTDTLIAHQAIQKADSLLALDAFDQGIFQLQQAAAIFKKQQFWESYVSCQIQIAQQTANHISMAKAQICLQKALQIVDEQLPQNSLNRGRACYEQGYLFIVFEKYDSAIHYLNLANPILTQHQAWNEQTSNIVYTAVAHFYKGNYKKAIAYLNEAKQLATKHQVGEDLFDTIYQLYGVIYFEVQGDYQKAIDTFEEVLQKNLAIKDKTALDFYNIATYYWNLGTFYNEQEDYQRSISYLQTALSYFQQSDTEHAQAEITDISIDIVSTQYSNKNYRTSLHLAHQLLAHVTTLPPSTTIAQYQIDLYRLLSANYTKLNKTDSAHFFLKKGFPLSKKISYRYSVYLKGQSEIYKTQKQYDKALLSIDEVISNWQTSDQKAAYFKQVNYYNLKGEILFLKKQTRQALAWYQKALAENSPEFSDTANIFANPPIATKVFRPAYLLTTLQLKAQALAVLDTAKALEYAFDTYQTAIALATKMRQEITTDASKIDLSITHAQLYEKAIALAHQLYQKTGEQKYVIAAFEMAEKNKGLALLESLRDAQGKAFNGVPDSLIEKERRLKINIAFHEQKQLEAQQNEETTKDSLYQSYLTDFKIQLAQLKDELQKSYSTYHAWEYQTDLANFATLQQNLLPNDQALIQYYQSDSTLYAFVIQKNATDFVQINPSSGFIDSLQAFIQLFRQPQTKQKNATTAFQQYTTLAHAMYQKIVGTISPLLKTTVTELVIVPDGILNYLPFDVLLYENAKNTTADYRQLPYLLKKYIIHYGYSATLLLENQRQFSQLPNNDRCLAFAPPYQNKLAMTERGMVKTSLQNAASPAHLKGTAKEIESIAQFFDGSFDASENATEAHFKKEAPKYGILHLAMHGEPDFDNSNFANLKFTNLSSDTLEDNLLHHYEIATMNLNAQLAVLSACETGIGKYVKGEGVMSLARSFMYAGVPSVVVSLWKMNDLTIGELMPLFYKNLSKNYNKAEALQQAKLSYLKTAPFEKTHPYYWAGVVSIGDNHPLKRSPKYGRYICGTVLLIVGSIVIIRRVFFNPSIKQRSLY